MDVSCAGEGSRLSLATHVKCGAKRGVARSRRSPLQHVTVTAEEVGPGLPKHPSMTGALLSSTADYRNTTTTRHDSPPYAHYRTSTSTLIWTAAFPRISYAAMLNTLIPRASVRTALSPVIRSAQPQTFRSTSLLQQRIYQRRGYATPSGMGSYGKIAGSTTDSATQRRRTWSSSVAAWRDTWRPSRQDRKD